MLTDKTPHLHFSTEASQSTNQRIMLMRRMTLEMLCSSLEEKLMEELWMDLDYAAMLLAIMKRQSAISIKQSKLLSTTEMSISSFIELFQTSTSETLQMQSKI